MLLSAPAVYRRPYCWKRTSHPEGVGSESGKLVAVAQQRSVLSTTTAPPRDGRARSSSFSILASPAAGAEYRASRGSRSPRTGKGLRDPRRSVRRDLQRGAGPPCRIWHKHQPLVWARPTLFGHLAPIITKARYVSHNSGKYYRRISIWVSTTKYTAH